MSIIEMRILIRIYENTRKHRIRNEKIFFKITIAPIVEKIRESHLRQFHHIQRKTINELVRKSMIQVQEIKKDKGNKNNINKSSKNRTCHLKK